MSGLLTLAGLATAVAALVLCGNDIRWQWYPNIDVDLLCGNPPLATTSEYGWGQEWRQQSSYGDPKWLEAECRTYMEMLTVRTERGLCPRGHRRPQRLQDQAPEARGGGCSSWDLVPVLWVRRS